MEFRCVKLLFTKKVAMLRKMTIALNNNQVWDNRQYTLTRLNLGVDAVSLILIESPSYLRIDFITLLLYNLTFPMTGVDTPTRVRNP